MALYRHPEIGYYEGRDSQEQVLALSRWVRVTDDQGNAVNPPDSVEDAGSPEAPPGSPTEAGAPSDDQTAVSEQIEIREVPGSAEEPPGPVETPAPTDTTRRTTAKKG